MFGEKILITLAVISLVGMSGQAVSLNNNIAVVSETNRTVGDRVTVRHVVNKIKAESEVVFEVRLGLMEAEIDAAILFLEGDALLSALLSQFNHVVHATNQTQKFYLLSFVEGENAVGIQAPKDVGAQTSAKVQVNTIAEFVSATVSHSDKTPFVRFIRTNKGEEIKDPLGPGHSAEQRARAFLEEHKNILLPESQQLELQMTSSGLDEVGIEHVRFKQQINAIPVFGGDVVVHLNDNGLVALNASLLPELDTLTTVPRLDESSAKEIAIAKVNKAIDVNLDAGSKKATLEYFNALQLGEVTPVSQTELTWFVDVQAPGVRQFVWVHAETGRIVNSIDQLTEARNRRTFDSNNTSDRPGTLIRTEGQGDTQNLEVDNAHNYAGDTYDYFFNHHGRDSFNNNGATLISSVNFCPNQSSCPYFNAFWDGVQMTYGTGFEAADDVVAHELAHAVTEYTAGLIYQGESGALNESFSDIFGESVDLLNTGGNDSASVRWKVGEDIPGIGAIRDMLNPNVKGDPAKVTDALFFCGSADNGGVHTNSGVQNHAFALLVDGGSFNGFDIQGIGLVKAGKNFYRALSQYLTPTSTFADAFDAVNQSCTDLVGSSGITTADCTQTSNALLAVEMNVRPCFTPPEEPLAFCSGGEEVNSVFADNLENSSSGKLVVSGDNHWLGGVGNPAVHHSSAPRNGALHLFGDNVSVVGDASVEMAQSVTIPANAKLQFEHFYDIENIFDGGVIEFSTNNGQNWQDAGDLITAGRDYVGTINSNFQNPLAGRRAFMGKAAAYASTQLDVSTLEGQQVKFRWRLGTDIIIGNDGWYIDDIEIFSCQQPGQETPEIPQEQPSLQQILPALLLILN